MELRRNALTAEDVSHMLQVNKNTVYALAKKGALTSYRVGRKMRFTLEDVQAYIDNSKKIATKDHALVSKNKFQSQHVQESLCIEQLIRQRQLPGLVLGGKSMILDILANYLSAIGVSCVRSYQSSYLNLVEMYYESVDAAAISLWDSSGNSYNLPFIKRLMPGVPVVVLHVARYTQGFLVKRGNPHNLRKWADLLREGITLVNREKGSDSRVLLDEQLRLLEADPFRIRGYSSEITSDLVQASLIAKKEADVGIGVEKLYHQIKGIDYLPLQTAQLVLVIAKRKDCEVLIQATRTCLKNQAFRNELSSMNGYDFNMIGETLYET